MTVQSALVIGVGASSGLGAALCRRIALEGYHVYAVGRTMERLRHVVNEINAAKNVAEPFAADVTREEDVIKLFDYVMSKGDAIAAPSLVIYNVGNNKQIPFVDLTPGELEAFLRTGPVGAFLVGREVARRIVPLGAATLIFTGASASLRGKPAYAHFAASKAGVRMISQSMAREFGPKGLHVAHVLIDGGIQGEKLLQWRPELVAERGENGLLHIDAIADVYWHLHQQSPSAWTQELDLRPFKETF